MSVPARLAHDWFPRPLPENVTLGEGSWCYSSFAFLHYRSERAAGVRVGRHSGIYHGTFFDLGPDGEVEVGDYCAVVGAIFATNRRVVIGDYAFLAHEVVLADSFAGTPPECGTRNAECGVPGAGIVASAGREAAIIIGENCWVGARAVLLSGARLGAGSIVGAAAVVDFEVPPHSIVAGNPARVVGISTVDSVKPQIR